MKNLKNIYFLLTMIFSFIALNSYSQSCNNGNLEDCNFSNWVGATGTHVGGAVDIGTIIPGFSTGGVNPRHSIVTSGNDPLIPALNRVDEGSCAMRLGNSLDGSEAELAKYTFIVDNSNKDFSFRYAMVMENPGHNGEPFFSYAIYKGSSWEAGLFGSIASEMFTADIANPYFNVQGDLVWRDWTTECIDLSQYIGKQVTIMFLVADCDQGGHFGYAYIDGLCANNDPIPIIENESTYCHSGDFIVNGFASIREDSHFWSVQESLADWTAVGTEYMEWFVAQDAGVFDVKNFVESKGGTLKCNTYYRVKLAVGNNCVPWAATTKLIYLSCPEPQKFEDRFYCCGDTPTVVFHPNDHHQNHVWEISPAQTNFPLMDGGVVLYPHQNTEITVTTTDEDGCTLTEQVKIWFLNDFNIDIVSTPIGCCSEKLSVSINLENGDCPLTQQEESDLLEHFEFQWSNGSFGQSILLDGDQPQSIYSVTASIKNQLGTSCFTPKTVSYAYTPFGKFMNTALYSRELIAPNTFTPGPSGGVNNIFKIWEFGPFAPFEDEPNAYGIIGYELTIFNRWGEIIYSHLDESCNIPQAHITWDGKDNSGSFVQPGVYPYKLEMITCSGRHHVCQIYSEGNIDDGTLESIDQGGDICIDGHVTPFSWPPFSWVCTEWLTPGTGDIDDITCIFSVTIPFY